MDTKQPGAEPGATEPAELDQETKNKFVVAFLAFAIVAMVAVEVFLARQPKKDDKRTTGPVAGASMIKSDMPKPDQKNTVTKPQNNSKDVKSTSIAEQPKNVMLPTTPENQPQDNTDEQPAPTTTKMSDADMKQQAKRVDEPSTDPFEKLERVPSDANVKVIPDEEAGKRDLAPKQDNPGEVEVEKRDGQTYVTLPDVPQAPSQGIITGKTGTKTKYGAIILGFDVLTSFEYIPQPPGIPSDKLPKQLPTELYKYSGKKVQVSGFMLPIDVADDGDVTMFFLMRDLASCCFGGAPKMNEWVLIEAGKGFSTKYTGYAPISVYGVIEVGEKIEYGRVTSIYRLTAEKLEKR